jgi:hypothetical protein
MTVVSCGASRRPRLLEAWVEEPEQARGRFDGDRCFARRSDAVARVLQHITGVDEVRNCGESDPELLLRPEAEVVLGGDVRRCCPTPDLRDSYNGRRPTRAGGLTAARLGTARRQGDASIAVAQPRAYARPGRRLPRRWSTWLLPPLDLSGRPAPQRDDSFRQEQSRDVDDHDDRFASAAGERRAIAMARGCRVITVSSGGFKTILGWLRTSLVVTGISRSCCRRT